MVGHPGSAVGEIAARTGPPQSLVSTAVARLKEADAVVTAADPADRRCLLARQAPQLSARVAEVRSGSVDEAPASALGAHAPEALDEVRCALDVLARHLSPGAARAHGPESAPGPRDVPPPPAGCLRRTRRARPLADP